MEDFHTPVDDYCRAWQGYNLGVPKINLNEDSDYFYIQVHMEKIYFSPEEEEKEEEEEKADYLCDYDCVTSTRTFWEPFERAEHNNLQENRISEILSEVGVPLDRQGFMLDQISTEADKIANSPFNKDKKILPMIVSIGIVALKSQTYSQS